MKGQKWEKVFIFVERHEETLYGDENIQYLYCDGDYMIGYVCQNSKKCILKGMNFTKCKLSL